MSQYLAEGGKKTRLRPGDIPHFEKEGFDCCLVSISRDGQKLSFEADGGPWGQLEYLFPCGPIEAQEIVSAIQNGDDGYKKLIPPKQSFLALQADCFHAIANGVSIQ